LGQALARLRGHGNHASRVKNIQYQGLGTPTRPSRAWRPAMLGVQGLSVRLRFLNSPNLEGGGLPGRNGTRRSATVFTTAGISLFAVAGCGAKQAPAGRWEGVYEASDTLIVARVQTQPDASVRLSAPDAIGIAGASDEERQTIKQRLAAGLASGW